MKKIIVLMCIMCFAQSAFAAVYNEAYIKEKTSEENYSVEQQDVKDNSAQKNTTYKRKIKFNNDGSSQSQSYWNFGKPNFGGQSFYH